MKVGDKYIIELKEMDEYGNGWRRFFRLNNGKWYTEEQLVNFPRYEERKTGSWVYVDGPLRLAYWKCSVCAEEPWKNVLNDFYLSEYCPHCGAKMLNPFCAADVEERS